MPEAEPTVRLQIEDGVAVLTLNRPEKLNAFAGDMRERLVAALAEAAACADARVLVVTGAGRGFCAGGDVDFMAGLLERGAPYAGLAPLVDAGAAAVARIDAMPFPVIAAVNGVAAGGGASLALACDVRLASSEARFAMSFVRIGLHLDWGASYALPRAAGLANALDLAWTGDIVPAGEMLRLGLVQRVWPAADFEREWRAYAARLAAAPQASVRLAKANLRASFSRTRAECLAAESAAQAACWEGPDAAEGVGALRGKRPPRFGAGVRAGLPGVPEPGERAPSPAALRFE